MPCTDDTRIPSFKPAHGAWLNTPVMEGFDGRRLKKALKIPSHFSIPVCISVGYANKEGARERSISKRFPPEEVFFSNKFGDPLVAASPTPL